MSELICDARLGMNSTGCQVPWKEKGSGQLLRLPRMSLRRNC